MGKIRNSNIELLRIICMLLIVASHYIGHGLGILPGVNGKVEAFILLWTRIAVGCFVVISGYFSANRQNGIYYKLKKLLADRLFYSLSISIIFLLIGKSQLNVDNIVYAIFPDLLCRHNFVASFLVLYLFIPFLNRMISALDYGEFKKLMLVFTSVFSIWPSIIGKTDFWNDNVYSYVGCMVYFYLLGAFLRIVIEKRPSLPKAPLVRLGGIGCVILVSSFCFSTKLSMLFSSKTQGLLYQNNIITVISIVFIFLTIIGFPEGNSKLVNWVAASNFAVILIHDDPLVRANIWSLLINKSLMENLSVGIFSVYMIGTIVAVYISCVLIDKLYKVLVNKYWCKFIFKPFEMVGKIYKK